MKDDEGAASEAHSARTAPVSPPLPREGTPERERYEKAQGRLSAQAEAGIPPEAQGFMFKPGGKPDPLDEGWQPLGNEGFDAVKARHLSPDGKAGGVL